MTLLLNGGFGQRIVQLGVSYMPFCYIMRMLIMCYHGEVMWQELSAGAARYRIDHAGAGRLDLENELGREKLLFSWKQT